jgi:hypothetical protein
MNKTLQETLKVCDMMFENCDIDFYELENQSINESFFEDNLNKRLVNSFLFNFSKLQDKIGAKLFKNILYELKEIDEFSIPMRDALNILEKLHIIDDQQDWEELREIRNTLSHEYPNMIDERVENIILALNGYKKLKSIYKNIKEKLNETNK